MEAPGDGLLAYSKLAKRGIDCHQCLAGEILNPELKPILFTIKAGQPNTFVLVWFSHNLGCVELCCAVLYCILLFIQNISQFLIG